MDGMFCRLWLWSMIACIPACSIIYPAPTPIPSISYPAKQDVPSRASWCSCPVDTTPLRFPEAWVRASRARVRGAGRPGCCRRTVRLLHCSDARPAPGGGRVRPGASRGYDRSGSRGFRWEAWEHWSLRATSERSGGVLAIAPFLGDDDLINEIEQPVDWPSGRPPPRPALMIINASSGSGWAVAFRKRRVARAFFLALVRATGSCVQSGCWLLLYLRTKWWRSPVNTTGGLGNRYSPCRFRACFPAQPHDGSQGVGDCRPRARYFR